jgi:hypothetical protein
MKWTSRIIIGIFLAFFIVLFTSAPPPETYVNIVPPPPATDVNIVPPIEPEEEEEEEESNLAQF